MRHTLLLDREMVCIPLSPGWGNSSMEDKVGLNGCEVLRQPIYGLVDVLVVKEVASFSSTPEASGRRLEDKVGINECEILTQRVDGLLDVLVV